MLALLRKEIISFFSSAVGYIVITIFLVLNGLLLWIIPGDYNVLNSGYASVAGLFMLAPWLYLFLIPAITMRTFAEEKKNGTIEILLTRPLSIPQVVSAKYLASLVLVLLSLLPTIVYYFTVYALGNPMGNIDSGSFWGAYIGLFLLASVYVSIGVFASSVSDNQVISFIVSALLCFALYYGFDVIAMLSSSASTQSIITALGINSHYESMSRGVIDTRDLIYFFSVIAVFIYTTILILSRKK